MTSVSDISTLTCGQLTRCFPQDVGTFYWTFTICGPSEVTFEHLDKTVCPITLFPCDVCLICNIMWETLQTWSFLLAIIIASSFRVILVQSYELLRWNMRRLRIAWRFVWMLQYAKFIWVICYPLFSRWHATVEVNLTFVYRQYWVHTIYQHLEENIVNRPPGSVPISDTNVM